MKTILLAITAALTIIGSINYMNQAVAPTSRFMSQTSTTPDHIQKAWAQWKMTNNKSYGVDSEDKYRMGVFQQNFNKVSSTNSKQNSFKLALNRFADLTTQEFTAQYTGMKKTVERRAPKSVKISSKSSVDWRGSAVTGVKDQGQCGSCWAFSTTGSLEGLNYQTNGSLRSFSEQQLVDCAGGVYGNNGCSGGLMDRALDYVEANGITLESNYYYTARDGTCSYTSSEQAFKNTSHTDVDQTDAALASALEIRPVSVGIDAGQLQLYDSGILHDWSCGTQLDHGVLAVGFTTETDSNGNTGAFIVKNSWGQSWGEAGFFRFARRSSGDGMCGITLQASYPTM